MQSVPQLSEEDFRHVEPYLPFGLALPPDADPIARVQGELKRMLLGQRIHPGQKIPLDTIAASLGVSRTPVREGLRLLETEGLVTALPNRGFIVRAIEADEARQLYEARVCIEAYLLPQALARIDATFVRDVTRLHDTYRRLLGDSPNRRRLGMLVDKAFHLRIARQAENEVLLGMLGNLFDRLMFTRPLDGFPPARMTDAVREHQVIVEGLRATATGRRNAPKIAAAILANIRNGGDAVVRYMQERSALPIAI